MNILEPILLQEKIIAENKRVHALENKSYLERHPEQTNFFQSRIFKNTVNRLCSLVDASEGNILELGCGTGYLYLEILKRGYKITGIDLSIEMINVLKDRVPLDSKERSKLIVSDVETFAGNNDEKYSAVVLSALLHHLYDFESVVRMYCDRLLPGGVFVIFFEPLKQVITSQFRYALHKTLANIDEDFYRRKMAQRKISTLEEEYRESDYQRKFGGIDPSRLSGIFKEEGFKAIEIEKYCARRYGLSSFLATRLLKTQNTFNLIAQK